jgi:hypothetical protein
MSRFRFRSPDGGVSTPQEWLQTWAERYPSNDYVEHDGLMAKHKSFSTDDFVQMGKWKDGVKTESRWRPNIASVAYPIWIQAASQLPKCPEQSEVGKFLNDWAGRTYNDEYPGRRVEKRFGLSRATTLLYFLSGGRFPIFDSRVRKAMTRLLGSPVPNTVHWYLDSYCPLFLEMGALCGAKDLRTVDMALFSYGAKTLPFSN